MDRGTLIRTIVLAIVILNQLLLSFGPYEIPGTEEQQTMVITTIFTSASAGVAWFKNNYITAKGKAQKTVLKANGLTKEQ